MRPLLHCAGGALLLAASMTTAQATGLLDNLKGAAASQFGGGQGSGSSSLLGGLGLPSIGSGTASNAAGVLQYCVERKYLSGGAEGVKNALLGKLGIAGKEEQDPGYKNGVAGLLQGSDGKSFDLGRVQEQLKDKACDYVLDNAKSLI